MGKWITAQQVADRLGLTRAGVYWLASEGRLPSYKLGRQVRFDEDEIAALMAAARRPAPDAKAS